MQYFMSGCAQGLAEETRHIEGNPTFRAFFEPDLGLRGVRFREANSVGL